MRDKADIQLIKTINEIRLLNLIREHGPISRNELSRKSRISKVAVSDIINRLDESGFILEIGKGKSTKKGGKRPTLLKLNAENGFVIGIEIKMRYTNVALANIESEILAMEPIHYEAGSSMDKVIPRIQQKIEQLFNNVGYDPKKLISIGIGIPGFVDYSRGELNFADTLRGWAHLPIAKRFTEYFHVNTIVENDVNTITYGESLKGAGRGRSNMVCIWIGDGIGSGIIVGRQMVRGENGNAGEIGYLELGHCVSNRDRIKHLYTNQRFFGEILSEVNLAEAIRMKLQWNVDSGNLHDNSIAAMLRAGDQGNAMVQEIVDEYAYILSILCMNFIKTLNPNLIILTGHVIEHSDYLLYKVRQLVKQSMINIPFQETPIVKGELNGMAGVNGAIEVALQTIFEQPVTKRENHVKVSVDEDYNNELIRR